MHLERWIFVRVQVTELCHATEMWPAEEIMKGNHKEGEILEKETTETYQEETRAL